MLLIVLLLLLLNRCVYIAVAIPAIPAATAAATGAATAATCDAFSGKRVIHRPITTPLYSAGARDQHRCI